MAKIEYDKEKIEAAIDKIVYRTMRMDLTWEWPGGVAYYGICAAADATGKDEYYDLLKKRIDEYIELGIPKRWTVNACAMGHCVLSLYQHYGDEKYLEIVRSKLDYLRNEAIRSCSIPYPQQMIFRNRHGPIHFLWRHFLCLEQELY